MSANYMELRAEFERVVEEMDWRDVFSTLQTVVGDLRDTANPPTQCPSPPPSPPPFVPAGNDGCSPLEAAPLMASPGVYDGQAAPIHIPQNVMQPGHLHSQAGAQSLGQFNNVPVMSLPDCMTQNLTPVGVLNGELVYGIPADLAAPSSSAVPQPPPNISISKKRWIEDQHDIRPYVKKPPNAFMLFMKEQRHNFTARLGTKGAAAINAILGQKWKELSKEEQAKYYEEAERQRQLHKQQHPDWSTMENYGKKRRESRKAPINVNASASTSTEVMQQAKKPRMTPVYTDVTGPSTSQTAFMETPWRQTVMIQPPHTGAPVTVPVCDMCHLPQVCGFDWTNPPPAEPMVSPAAPTGTETAESDHLAWVGGPDSLMELLEAVEFLPAQPEPQPQPQDQPQHQVQPLPQPPSSPNTDICTLDFSDLL